MNPAPVSRAHWLLRDRRFTSFLALFAVAALAAFFSVLLVDNLLVLKSTDNFVQDIEITRESRTTVLDPRVVIVAIDDYTLKHYPYRSPVNRDFLAKLIGRLDSVHPKAIGVDLLFDQPTLPADDAELENVITTAKTPLVIAYTENPTDVTTEQLSYLRSYVPDRLRATPDTPTDQYGTVRTIHPGMKEGNGRYLFSFERALASKYGVQGPSRETPIVWHIPPDEVKIGSDASTDEQASSKSAYNYFEISAQKILEFNGAAFSLTIGPALFKNKIVLIGSDLSLVDRHRTPLATVSSAGIMPGVAIHAYGLSTLLDGSKSPYATWRVNFFIALVLGLIGSVLGMLNFHLLPRIGALALVLVIYWTGCIYLYHYSGLLLGLLAPGLAAVAAFSAMDSLTGRDARRQRQFIQGAFSRYVSPKVVEQLIADPSRMSLEGERREMTFLFTDIADFTTMSEKIDSKELGHILNAYFEGMTGVVLRYDGMVDKFIGDAVFAIFNAPLDLADHAKCAVKCALEMDEFSNKFRKEQHAAGINIGITRVGIHTGFATIGNFGSKSRFTYTAHGDAVNTASRLEGLNKEFGTHICVSKSTMELCPDIEFRPIGSVVLKGKTEAVEVYEPLHPGALSQEQLARYRKAFADMHEPDSDSLSLFETLAEELPDDPCVRHHVRRLQKGNRERELVMHEK